MRFDEWREVGDRIFVRRHTSFDLNVGLVVGADACLVIDSRESQRAGMELARTIRTITPAPWTVVNTQVSPTDTFAAPSHDLDVGGRPVSLRHLGRGHTDNDIIVGVDDVIFAGDLVEQGAPPSFDDAYPGEWPATLAALLPLCRGPVVPGHGDVVDATFVRDQQAVLSSVAHLSREEAAHSLRGLLG